MPTFNENVTVNDKTGTATVTLDGEKGDLKLGKGKDTIVMNAVDGSMQLLGGLKLGVVNSPGSLVVRDKNGSGTIVMTSAGGLGLGAVNSPGTLSLRDDKGAITISVTGIDGRMRIRNMFLKRMDGTVSIVLDGESGDIQFQGADCAEDFDIVDDSANVTPGTVMVINDDGQLCQSSRAYDTTVAGVVSGAGDYKPGIVLGKGVTGRERMPIALVGKVFCKVDAAYAPIRVGDLLTTSSTPGHAMKVMDQLSAFGAVIGKALGAVATGQSLIPILIALQ